MDGSSADHVLAGGGGNDDFYIRDNFSRDVITNFQVGDAGSGLHDVIHFKASVFADWDHVLAATTDSADGAVITSSADDSLTLTGVTKAQLVDNPETDFSFF